MKIIKNILNNIVAFFRKLFIRPYKEFPQKFDLKFNSKGEFKIMQLTDIHQHSEIDLPTINLISRIIDDESPDLVVITGDNIEGTACITEEGVKKAIDSIARVMEDRKIPWAVTLGNHDCECKVGREKQMEIYKQYQYNLSQSYSMAFEKAGDYNILIKDSKGMSPVFNIYLLDSGDSTQDYINKHQVSWYKNTAFNLRHRYNKVIPAIMFFHIPLKQQFKAWQNRIDGERNEEECIQSIDCKFLDELIKVKDVKAVFCGHDHINDYYGKLNNIIFGYGRKTGFNNYGKEGFKKGARIFILNEGNPGEFKTYEVLE
ncbi:metallophosphoesterase family protein [Clostridium omnivorum]|uniref:Phosphohydrolase n=1 Tax=Clostridium omnivorum TaxID=1604902 RepID=A0ABQ5N7R6_9CLOT|nr:metallophosphoesterase family protein [Clostridium sp. E14]GLC31293.1 phosphohydrolase [Clostridium sp. E14]